MKTYLVETLTEIAIKNIKKVRNTLMDEAKGDDDTVLNELAMDDLDEAIKALNEHKFAAAKAWVRLAADCIVEISYPYYIDTDICVTTLRELYDRIEGIKALSAIN